MCAGAIINSRIKKLQFLSLRERFAIILLITDLGHVESKKIIIPEAINFRDIEKVIKLLNQALHDCPIFEIDKKYLSWTVFSST